MSLAALSGCNTVRTAENSKVQTFTSPYSSEVTYRHVVTNVRTCYDRLDLRVRADYFPEAKEGNISLVFSAAFVAQEAFRVEIRPAGSESTVTLIEEKGNWARRVPGWIEGAEPC